MSIHLLLIKNEFSLFKKQIIAYALLTLIALAIMALPSKSAAHLGSILLITGFVAFYCHLITSAIIKERKNKNHLLLITLPVRLKSLVYNKITSVLLIFFSLWIPLYASVMIVISMNDAWPAISLAFYSIGFVLFLPASAVILATAAITFSEGLTILAFVISNVCVSIILNYLPNTGFMQAAFEKGSIAEAGILWPHEINSWLVAEMSLFTLLILAIYLTTHFKRQYI